MIKINIIGGIFGTDGYSSHTRSLANALYKVADCRLSTQPVPNWEKLVNDAELQMLTKPERKEDYNLIISMPHQWKVLMGPGKNIGYCVWEGDKVPKSWVDEFLNPKIDYIFVPSNHTKDAIINTCNLPIQSEIGWFTKLINKIHIIPHGVDHKLFYSQRKKDKDDGSNVSLSGDTKQIQGKNNKDEQMPVYGSNLKDEPADNHADTDALTKPAKNVVAASRIEGRRFTLDKKNE